MKLYKISEKGELIKLDKLHFEENDVYLVDDEEKNTLFIWVGLKVSQEKKDITAEIARKIDKDRGGSTKILIMKEKREYGSFLAMMHDLGRGLIPGVSIERRPEFVFEAPPESITSVGLDGTPEERELKPETRIVAWLQQIEEHRTYQKPQEEEKISIAAEFVRFDTPPVELEVEESSQIGIPPEAKVEEIYEEEEKLLTAAEFVRFDTPSVELEVEEDSQIESLPELDVEVIHKDRDFETHIREAAYFLSLNKYSYNDLCWMLAEKIQNMSMDLPSIEDIKRKAEEVFRSSCSYDELCWLNAEMDHLISKSFLEKKKREFY